jgi:hypothetical protein
MLEAPICSEGGADHGTTDLDVTGRGTSFFSPSVLRSGRGGAGSRRGGGGSGGGARGGEGAEGDEGGKGGWVGGEGDGEDGGEDATRSRPPSCGSSPAPTEIWRAGADLIWQLTDARVAMIAAISTKLPSCVVPSWHSIVGCGPSPADRIGRRPTRSMVRMTSSGDALGARMFLTPRRRPGAAQYAGALVGVFVGAGEKRAKAMFGCLAGRDARIPGLV